MTTETIDRPHITDNDLNHFKKMLNVSMRELLDQADSAVSELIMECSRDTELIDSTSADINRTMNLRLHSRKSRLIKKIKDALKRIVITSYSIHYTKLYEGNISEWKFNDTGEGTPSKTLKNSNKKRGWHISANKKI